MFMHSDWASWRGREFKGSRSVVKLSSNSKAATHGQGI